MEPAARQPRLKLHWQVGIALLLAVIAGSTLGQLAWFVAACDFVGSLFLNALKMVVVPLIMASIIHALLGLSDGSALTRMGTRAMIYYLSTCLMAVLIGLLMVNLIHPGIIDGLPAGDRLGLNAAGDDIRAKLGGHGVGDIIGVFQRMVPANLIEAAASGNLLGIVFFSLLYGYFASRLPTELAESQRRFWGGLRGAMLGVTGLVIMTAPLGVFALVAKTVAATGWDAIRPLALFFVTVLGGLALQMFVGLGLTLKLIARVSPWRHLRAMSPALLTAFSSSTSAGTLPVTMDCLQNRAGVSARVTSFVLPLGSAINLDGSALYECVVAMFLAQAYGIELSFATQFVIVLMAVLTSMGVAGIPSASLVAISVILGAIGLPLEGLGVILAVDRVLDMCRTAVNVYGDSCATVVVARLEGETGILQAPN
ncbi:MAG: sodium:dicarboxylate symporter [Nevskia sp.]|nr:sodium:dicarboxylate symporter [Nevskia sp.]